MSKRYLDLKEVLNQSIGFPEVQRKVVALSSDPGPRFSALEAMHPLVKCDKNDMTFTASGQGLSYLLVDREGASPISVFQLPQYCGYSVKATWSNLEMIVPYDGCFITQENGNYVLHMLWLGSLLKMSCPIMAAASPLSPPSSPSVFCSPDGMAVQIRVQKQGVPVLGVLVIPQFTHTHSPPQDPPSSPGVLQLPLNTDPARTVPTSPLSTPSQTQNQEQAAQLPGYPYYPYPGLQYHQLPQVNPSAPQSSHPLQPTISTPPESQQQRFQYPSGPDLPPAREKPQKPEAPQDMCLSSSDPSCSDYPYHHIFHPQHYDQPYPSLPSYPQIQPPVTKIPSTTIPWLGPQTPYLQCLKGKLVVLLPFADPDSIQVRDHLKTWLLLSSVSQLCGYMLQRTTGHGVILLSPLPACHSQLQNKTWDLRCPYQSVAETPAPAVPSISPPSPSTTKDEISPFVTRTKVFCFSQQMTFRMSPDGSATDVQRGEVEGANYVITVIYMTESGRKEAHVSCPVVIPRSENECNLHSEYRLPCGSSSVSQTQCLSMGCCFDKHPPACYYPMDECTIDRRMIFYVPASLTDPPLSPGLLVAANNSTCKPQKATSEYALFNIPMDGCGTRRVVVSKTVVYMVEITNVIQTVGLNYGIITRDSPVRLLVECRYVPGTSLSVSYVVKTPTLGPEIHTQGVFGVQLRIAKDAHYNSYYPQYHQPLHMLLGKPLHLEVRLLNSPDPSLVLLVHFCVAYPRSGKAVWVLLYNGCPNPLDPEPPKTVLAYPKPAPSPQSQTRRFTISTFQFLPDGEFQDMDEEVYFMCSTEICSPRDGPCVEGCFGH
ncbi:uncharacterized protein LOC142378112 [Odontesthes bonariensis]|uniref:uncharacterized protein LOC142378112 n=1 Tax=Odontesthes bonariensis TaxID=219752 RepID=UPI003F588700